MMLRVLLKVWGWICLLCAAVVLLCSIYFAAVNPSYISTLGSMDWVEWTGMGLISLGVARILEHLEKK